MTISALDRAADGDRLERTLELYRDLSLALRDRIALLKAGTGDNADCKTTRGSLEEHQRALRAVLELEVSLGIRSRAWGGGTGELDLDAARAEIVARLARGRA